MNIKDFNENLEGMNDNAIQPKMIKMMENALERLKSGDITAREFYEYGLLDVFVDMEADDIFGTEGMDL